MWIGKLIAGIIGFSTAGFFGGLIGLLVGHYFDKGLVNVLNPVSREQQAVIQEQFFQTVFLLLGKLAKADGRVSEQEIAHTEQLMSQMGLGSDHRQQAIAHFKRGTQPDLSVAATLQEFNAVCGGNRNLKRLLLNYLLSLALADGVLAGEEEKLLREVAGYLGISPALFDQLIAMIRAQSQFRGYQHGGHRRAASENDLQTAYAALGVEPAHSDTEIKRAYRKLMSENHPDKLMGQGVPEDMIKLATERSQEIQTAYDLIRSSRAGNGGR